MSLLNNLENVRNRFKTEVEAILNFIEEIENSMARKDKRWESEVWSDGEINEMKKIHSHIGKMLSHGRMPISVSVGSEKIVRVMRDIVMGLKYSGFLGEMTLSYLISHQEAFIKEYLYVILTNRKSILKSKEKQLSYDEVCGFKSIRSLISYMAHKEADTLGYDSIDEIAKHFRKQFDVDFEKFTNWADLREATYRRNLIIHNGGVTNDIYCSKTGYKQQNEHLSTNADYVKNICKFLLGFIEFLHDQMAKKLKLIQTKSKNE